MNNEQLVRIIEALAVTAEVMGQQVSANALTVMAGDLSSHPVDHVLKAIERCRRECSRLTLAAIIERVQANDGRPEPDEAWAIAVGSEDERASVVWTDEIAQASSAVSELLESRDRVGARMAFLRTYERLVRAAREAGAQVKWSVSLGWSPEGRAQAVADAVCKGYLTSQHAEYLIGNSEGDSSLTSSVAGLLGATSSRGKTEPTEMSFEVREHLAAMRAEFERADKEATEKRRLQQEQERSRFEERKAFELQRLQALANTEPQP